MAVPGKRRAVVSGVCVATAAMGGVVACSGLLGIDNRTLDPGADAGGDVTVADAMTEGFLHGDGAGDVSAGETGPCGDIMSDTHNCGRCNHDCLGGACSAGVCQPVPIVPGDAGYRPWQVAVSATAVYFTDNVNGEVLSVNKDGTGLTALDYGGLFDTALGLDDAGVFFSSDTPSTGSIHHCALPSCAAGSTTLATDPAGASVGALALDQGVTFTDGCNLYRLPTKGMGTPTALIVNDGGSSCSPAIDDVTSDGTYLYFTQDDGHVLRMDLDGGGLLDLSGSTMSTPQANGLAIDSQGLYWAQKDPNDTTPGTIRAAGLDGTNPHVLASNQANPLRIVSDGTNVYWTNNGFGMSGNSGTVMMCAPGNCQPVTLASQQPNPWFIAVDDQAVYWTDWGGVQSFPGSVMKVAKP